MLHRRLGTKTRMHHSWPLLRLLSKNLPKLPRRSRPSTGRILEEDAAAAAAAAAAAVEDGEEEREGTGRIATAAAASRIASANSIARIANAASKTADGTANPAELDVAADGERIATVVPVGGRDAARDAARDVVRHEARDAVKDAVKDEVKDEVRDVVIRAKNVIPSQRRMAAMPPTVMERATQKRW